MTPVSIDVKPQLDHQAATEITQQIKALIKQAVTEALREAATNIELFGSPRP